MTGTKKDRPELIEMMNRVTEGDTVVIKSFSRLGRSTKDLIELMETFNNKGVNIVSLKERIDTTTSTGKLQFTLISAIAQFERDIISDITKESLASSRARGRIGGRPRTDDEKMERAIRLYNTKEYSVKEIKEMTGISKSTLYREISVSKR